jgi:hypothetical protein
MTLPGKISKKYLLGLLASAIIVSGTLSMPSIYAASNTFMIQVKNAVTSHPEPRTVCAFVFASPDSGLLFATTNAGGIAKVPVPAGDTEVRISDCQANDGTFSDSSDTIPLIKGGTTKTLIYTNSFFSHS